MNKSVKEVKKISKKLSSAVGIAPGLQDSPSKESVKKSSTHNLTQEIKVDGSVENTN